MLVQCLESVKNQTYNNIVHHIFVDGKENLSKVEEKISFLKYNKYCLNVIDQNVGKGWYGHRIYAACSFLVNQDLIVYLDEDNWFQETHIESLVSKINNNDWVYSLRKIFCKDAQYICDDNCESLGKWPVYFDEKVRHIDTSSFMIKKNVALAVGHSWYGKWGADRQFFAALNQYFPNYDCTGEHTLCYRLGGNETSVQKDFFLKGNAVQKEKYGAENNFPWLKKRLQLGPGISIEV
jgi:glycosyltransferase involved in cell wall biosynthesis